MATYCARCKSYFPLTVELPFLWACCGCFILNTGMKDFIVTQAIQLSQSFESLTVSQQAPICLPTIS